MDFRLWLESIDSIDKKIDQIKLIINTNDYTTIPQKLADLGIEFSSGALNRYKNLDSGTGSKLTSAIYEFLAHVDPPVSTTFDPDLKNKIATVANKIKTDFGFNFGTTSNFGWFFFKVTNPDGSENPQSRSLEKLHFKINPDNLNQIYDLAAIIKKNPQFFSEFKVHNDMEKMMKTDENSFVLRRDNFIAFLSDAGAKEIENVKKLFAGINFEVGQDYYDPKSNLSLSHTETKSIELALEMLKKHPNFKPGSNRYFQILQGTYIKSKFGIDVFNIAPPAPPDKLVIQGEKGEETFDNNRIWGREDIKKILPEDKANFFSISQFDIRKSNQGWFLWPMPKLSNQTIINGKVLTTPTKLNVNDKIGLQGKTGKQIVPFTVKTV